MTENPAAPLAALPTAPPTVAILLVNLGTPEAPTPGAVRRYLAEFLSDPRVVELPRWVWWPILHGIILRFRPRKSALKYASIWQPEGSPLRVFTAAQAEKLQAELDTQNIPVQVRYAMRYGSPAIASVLDELKRAGCERILVLPLYPQYAASTSASVMDEVAHWLLRTRVQPEIRTVRDFADDAAYLDALAETLRAHWQQHGPLGPEGRLLMSFHGLPQRAVDLGDPYQDQCLCTARLLADRLGLAPDQFVVSFQSRFGRAKWLQPYTAQTVKRLAHEGISRLDVLCPGFVADCLETREEIALEVRQDYLVAGGKVFHYIPCLNDGSQWITALAQLCGKHLHGWLAEDGEACWDGDEDEGLEKAAIHRI